MDVVTLPFVLGAILFSHQGRLMWSSGLLALAVGTKIWPVVLFPLILRPVIGDFKKTVGATTLFSGMTLLIFIPVIQAGFSETSGFLRYGRTWE